MNTVWMENYTPLSEYSFTNARMALMYTSEGAAGSQADSQVLAQ